MNQEIIPAIDAHAEYWEAQILFVRVLQNSGLKVGIKDRLPLFRLWILVDTRMAGIRRTQLLNMIQVLVRLRTEGKEPPHKGNKYT